MTATIMPFLKERTRCLHEQAEAAVNLSASLRSLDTYGQFLGRFLGFYEPLEERLRDVPGLSAMLLDLERRQKGPALRRDLHVLNWSPAAMADLPRCHHLPPISDIESALGCLYVLEGSTLGGQYIRRTVEKRLGLDAFSGCAFFTGYGPEQTRQQWLDFGGRLNDFHQQFPQSEHGILASAESTFRSFKEWFECRVI